jgi:signal peptidase II
MKEKIRPFLLTLGIILLDQITKIYISTRWPGDNVFIRDVFGNDFLWIIHVRNRAIAFSLGDGLPAGLKTLLFVVVPLVVLGVLIWYYLKTNELTVLQRWSVAGIIGGGLGNLIDRIFRPQGVVDFISVNFYGFLGFSRWPTFNIADSSVVVCGILLFLSVAFPKTRKEGVSV